MRTLGVAEAWAFNSEHIHDVRNLGTTPALSVHAYSPRLTTMTRYQLVDGRLEIDGIERAGEGW